MKFEDQIVIKLEPELRHVLAHLIVALYAVIDGNLQTAEENLRSVESTVFFGSEEDELTSLLKRKAKSMAKKKRKRKRPMRPKNPCTGKK